MVRTPAGEVVLDPTGRAPGRGAYVCADPACQHRELTRAALRRALDVPIPAGLFGSLPVQGADADDVIADREGGS